MKIKTVSTILRNIGGGANNAQNTVFVWGKAEANAQSFAS